MNFKVVTSPSTEKTVPYRPDSSARIASSLFGGCRFARLFYSHQYCTGSADRQPYAALCVHLSHAEHQQTLDENHLEIVDSEIQQNMDGTKVEIFIARITPDTPNPLKIAEKLQQANAVVALADPDLATLKRIFALQQRLLYLDLNHIGL